MPLRTLFKFIFLLISLAITILVIVWLKQNHLSAFWTSLGINSNRLNWCEERVRSLYVFDLRARLYESEGIWHWEEENEDRTLDYLRVEKWFAKYCQVDTNVIDFIETNQKSRAFFEVEFLDGNRFVLHERGDYFEIRGQLFQSKALRRGLKELLAFSSKIE